MKYDDVTGHALCEWGDCLEDAKVFKENVGYCWEHSYVAGVTYKERQLHLPETDGIPFPTDE